MTFDLEIRKGMKGLIWLHMTFVSCHTSFSVLLYVACVFDSLLND